MKMPNGYGSVYKLSGKRRNPWVVAKTDGYELIDGKSKRKYHIVGYFPTRAAAMQALADFNDNPYDLDLSKVTFAEIYHRWFSETFNDESNAGTIRNYEAAFKKTTAIQSMKMSDIRPPHMQAVIDSVDGGYQSASRVLTLFNKLYKWCIQHDCIKKNYAEMVKINVRSESKPRQRFSTEEINKIFKAAKQNKNAELVITLLFTGVRVMELFDLKKKDVDLDAQCFVVRHSKTEAGIRTVPIANAILPIFQRFMSLSKCEYAFCNQQGYKMTYDNFKRRYWQPLMLELNMTHTIHETRHTFISMATAKNINPTLIKKIVGHKSVMSLTERVYTHPEISEMLEAVNLLVTC